MSEMKGKFNSRKKMDTEVPTQGSSKEIGFQSRKEEQRRATRNPDDRTLDDVNQTCAEKLSELYFEQLKRSKTPHLPSQERLSGSTNHGWKIPLSSEFSVSFFLLCFVSRSLSLAIWSTNRYQTIRPLLIRRILSSLCQGKTDIEPSSQLFSFFFQRSRWKFRCCNQQVDSVK